MRTWTRILKFLLWIPLNVYKTLLVHALVERSCTIVHWWDHCWVGEDLQHEWCLYCTGKIICNNCWDLGSHGRLSYYPSRQVLSLRWFFMVLDPISVFYLEDGCPNAKVLQGILSLATFNRAAFLTWQQPPSVSGYRVQNCLRCLPQMQDQLSEGRFIGKQHFHNQKSSCRRKWVIPHMKKEKSSISSLK